MANFIDIAENIIVRTSGTVNQITSPVYAGSHAIEFNSLSGGSVVDGNGKIYFTVPSGIGTGDFTLEGWVSVSDASYLPEYILDVAGLDVQAKIVWTGSSTGYGFSTSLGDSTSYTLSGSTNITDETYFHFMLTRVSGTVRWFTDGSLTRNLGTISSDIDGTTIYLGDLGDDAGHFRLDALRISNTDRYGVGDGSPTSFTPDPPEDAEDVNTGVVVVAITGQTLTPVDGASSLEINSAIGDQDYVDTQTYVALSYFNHTTQPNVATDIATVNLQINSAIGDQDYLDTQDYVALSYFNHTTEAISAPAIATELVISSSLSVDADELGEVSIAIQATTSIVAVIDAAAQVNISASLTLTCQAGIKINRINDRYTIIVPRQNRVNKVSQQTRVLLV